MKQGERDPAQFPSEMDDTRNPGLAGEKPLKKRDAEGGLMPDDGRGHQINGLAEAARSVFADSDFSLAGAGFPGRGIKAGGAPELGNEMIPLPVSGSGGEVSCQGEGIAPNCGEMAGRGLRDQLGDLCGEGVALPAQKVTGL